MQGFKLTFTLQNYHQKRQLLQLHFPLFIQTRYDTRAVSNYISSNQYDTFLSLSLYQIWIYHYRLIYCMDVICLINLCSFWSFNMFILVKITLFYMLIGPV